MKGRALLLLCFLLSLVGRLHAQEVVRPMTETQIKPILTNVFVYAAGSRVEHGNMWTANNTVFDKKYLYGKYMDLGAGVELYRAGGFLQYNGSLGYKYQFYDYNKGLFGAAGVDSHWLSADVKVESMYFGAGIKSDVYLGSKIKNRDNFSFNGIYPDSFNPMSLCWYAALHFRFTRLKFEARLGSYIVPPLSPQKISYYNITKTHIEALYFEMRLSCRIFTSGEPLHAPSMFND